MLLNLVSEDSRRVYSRLLTKNRLQTKFTGSGVPFRGYQIQFTNEDQYGVRAWSEEHEHKHELSQFIFTVIYLNLLGEASTHNRIFTEN